jgi:hypothetical protein
MSLFIPKTGGRFDAAIAGNDIKITHKFGLINDASKPLTQTDFDQWKLKFTTLIKSHWEGKYSFKRGSTTCTPKFLQIFEEDATNMADAHYVIRVRDGQGGSELVSSKPAMIFDALAQQGLYFPMASNLAAGSVNPTTSFQMIAQSMPSFFPCYVDTFGGALKPQTKAHVGSLARQVAGVNPNQKLYVTAYGTSKTASRTVVVNELRGGGLVNVHARESKKMLNPSNWGTSSHSRASGRTDYVKISLDEDIDVALLQQSALYTYPAAVVHEFGHMLGLKDEYACLSDRAASKMVKLDFIDASDKNVYMNMHMNSARTETTEVAEQQREFVKYCKEAGVVPTTFGQYTSSIMSAGSEFHPCHFVTIWAALVHLSRHDDWTIV